MIRFGDAKSIPELKKLWKTCFADEDAYIDAFFDILYEDRNVLLEEENGVLMGASFFLPGEICLRPQAAHLACSGMPVKWQEIRYVYALAVYPQYRGQGMAKALLRRAYEIYGAPLIAEPAEEGLVGGFYEPLGFAKSFYLEKKCVEMPRYDVQAAEILSEQAISREAAERSFLTSAEAGPLKGAYFCPVQAEEYCRIRDAYFQKHGYVRWPMKHIAFAIQEHCGSGGGAYVFRKDGREDLLLYYREGQDVIVTETTLNEKEITDMFLPWISGTCSRLILKRAAKQPGMAAGKTAQTGQEQSDCLTGMSYGLSSVYGYLNLSLD